MILPLKFDIESLPASAQARARLNLKGRKTADSAVFAAPKQPKADALAVAKVSIATLLGACT